MGTPARLSTALTGLAICTKDMSEHGVPDSRNAVEHKGDMFIVRLQMVTRNAVAGQYPDEVHRVLETNGKVQMLRHGNHLLSESEVITHADKEGRHSQTSGKQAGIGVRANPETPGPHSRLGC